MVCRSLRPVAGVFFHNQVAVSVAAPSEMRVTQLRFGHSTENMDVRGSGSGRSKPRITKACGELPLLDSKHQRSHTVVSRNMLTPAYSLFCRFRPRQLLKEYV